MNLTFNSKKVLDTSPIAHLFREGEALDEAIVISGPAVYEETDLSALKWSVIANYTKYAETANQALTAVKDGDSISLKWVPVAEFYAHSDSLQIVLIGSDTQGTTVIKILGSTAVIVAKAARYVDTASADNLQKIANQILAGVASLPAGGTTGQVLAKKSDEDADVEWVDQQGGGGTSGVTDVKVNGTSVVTNKVAEVTVPTALSDLTDDSTHRTVTDAEKAAWNAGGGSGSIVTVDQVLTEGTEIAGVTVNGTRTPLYAPAGGSGAVSSVNGQTGAVVLDADDVGALPTGYHDSTKQDTISDLSTIRSGAAAGATALQEVPSTYRTSAAQDAIDATKADAPTVLTATLAAGATSVSWTNSAITDTAVINLYTDVWGVSPTAVEQSGTALTLTFDAQSADISVKVVIS